jgi:hypothetical protein
MLRLGHACAAIVLLAACGQPPEPIEPKAAAATPARPSQAMPTSAPPTMPQIAKRHDEIGAANFVLYWVKVSNYASHTGDTARLTEISEPTCQGCSSYIDLFESTYERGGYFKGSDWRISDIAVEAGQGDYLVHAHVTAKEGVYQRSRDARVETGNDENTDLAFVATQGDAGWKMSQLGLESELQR